MSNTGYQDSNKGFGSKEDVYTKEELMKFLRRDSDEYSHAMYYKLTLTLMHKMLGEDHEVYQLTNDEIEELKKCPKTEALDLLLGMSVSMTFHLKNGMIKQIEKIVIDSENKDYAFVKKKYLDDLLFYFLRDKMEDYHSRASHSGLTLDDISKNLMSKDLEKVVNDIFGSGGYDLSSHRIDELLGLLNFDEKTKQAHLGKAITSVLKNAKSIPVMATLFNFVEDKERLFSVVKSGIASDKKEQFALLENAYLESKLREDMKEDNDLVKVDKKRL